MSSIRLPDPFTHPNEAPGFLSAPLVDNQPLLVDEMPNGKVIKTKSSAQFWGINISYPDLYETEYRMVSSAINESKRLGSNIELVLPQHIVYRVTGDTSVVSIPAGLKGSVVEIDGTDILRGHPHVGDLFKLSTHPKVYKITKFTKEKNKFIIYIYPDLFITTNGSEKPEFNDIRFQMTLVEKSLVENINVDGLYTDVAYQFRESL